MPETAYAPDRRAGMVAFIADKARRGQDGPRRGPETSAPQRQPQCSYATFAHLHAERGRLNFLQQRSRGAQSPFAAHRLAHTEYLQTHAELARRAHLEGLSAHSPGKHSRGAHLPARHSPVDTHAYDARNAAYPASTQVYPARNAAYPASTHVYPASTHAYPSASDPRAAAAVSDPRAAASPSDPRAAAAASDPRASAAVPVHPRDLALQGSSRAQPEWAVPAGRAQIEWA
ncbi:hypothetical protein HDZ31DRAFT_78961, partial [Schizophyllum fasciatum]